MQTLEKMRPLSRRYADQPESVKFSICLIAGHWIGQIPIHEKREKQAQWVAIIERWLINCCSCTDNDLIPFRALIQQKIGY